MSHWPRRLHIGNVNTPGDGPGRWRFLVDLPCVSGAWRYALAAGLIALVVLAALQGPFQRDPVTIAVFRSGGLPPSVVGVAEETARRHGSPDLRVLSFPYPASRADLVSLVRRVIEDVRPSAVIDLGNSNEGLVASSILERAGVPHVLPFQTSGSLQRATANTFALVPTDSAQGVALARHAAETLGVRRLSFFYLDSEHGVGIREGLVPEADRLGLELLSSVPFAYVEDPGVIVDAALLRGTPDGIVVAGYPGTGGPLIRALRRRLPGLPLLGSDGMASNPPVLIRSSGPDREPLHLVSFWRLEESRECPEGFSRWIRADSLAPLTGVEGLIHDAVAPVAEAVGAGWTDPAEIAVYLRSLGRSARPFEGVTGSVAFGGEMPGIEVRVGGVGARSPRTPEEGG